ncbi:protein SPEAR3 [Impatiens glandulifera]|uniref:protein SPEAR3 n=1 Tax=Impatiens glandulifera TaxID=253017 RepID=UPI001FB136CD|nr:protein SPEAR3 [Impatiens glandulifera]
MGSNYFGEMNIGSSGNERSSRKNRKNNNNSEKPKQPQRGLGVAQLEKMRLHGQINGCSYLSPYPTTAFNQEDLRLQTPYSSSSSLSSSSSYGYQGHQSFLMGMNEFSRTNINFGDSHAKIARWNNTAGNGMTDGRHYVDQTSMTGHFFNTQEDIQKNYRGDRMTSIQNCDTSYGNEEVDLELRLSL